MADLRLGPLLRYVDDDSATVWVETDRPCEAVVACDSGVRARADTWCVAGHHYALVTVTGLTPGKETAYRVELDGEQVWPPREGVFPPSTIRTRPAGDAEDAELYVAFGSCRWAAERPGRDAGIGPDALDTLARRIAGGDGTERLPDVLLLLGDQIYADETSPRTQEWLADRRDLSEPPWTQVADYEEYTRLYYESWLDPEVRWLLSTVPTCMIFDDHDVIDDWNTSQAWLEDIRATGWWSERITGGLMTYWVYQHLGNLSPRQLATDELFAVVRESADGTAAVRRFAEGADRVRAGVRWSYRRDFGRVRLLVIDSRSARVLEEDRRAMVDDGELAWIRAQLLDDRDYDHLLVGTSLPWLLPPAIHDVEAWDAALCAGARGPRWAARGERLRRRADLEHWAAFRASFDALAALLGHVAGLSGGRPAGVRPPATICVLSGDVHHGYAAETRWPASRGRAGDVSRVLQLTCSPVHNTVPPVMRVGFRFGWSLLGRLAGRLLARHGRVPRTPVSWRRLGGPWFGNQLMTLTLAGRSARLRLHQVHSTGDEPEPRMVTAFDTVLAREDGAAAGDE
jgi:PhoD-like phosphatase